MPCSGTSASDIRSMEGSSMLPPIPEQGPQTVELAAQLEVVKDQVVSCKQLCRDELTSLRQALEELTGRTHDLEVVTAVVTEQTCKLTASVSKQLAEYSEQKDLQEHTELVAHTASSAADIVAPKTSDSACVVTEDIVETDVKSMPVEVNAGKADAVKAGDTMLDDGALSTLTQIKHAALEADIDTLRDRLHRLISVDLHAIANNMQELQVHSSEMMDIVSEYKDQAQCIESICKERFSEQADNLRAELYAMIQTVQEPVQRKQREALSNEIQATLHHTIRKLEEKCERSLSKVIRECQHTHSIPGSDQALLSETDSLTSANLSASSTCVYARQSTSSESSVTSQEEQAGEALLEMEEFEDTSSALWDKVLSHVLKPSSKNEAAAFGSEPWPVAVSGSDSLQPGMMDGSSVAASTPFTPRINLLTPKSPRSHPYPRELITVATLSENGTISPEAGRLQAPVYVSSFAKQAGLHNAGAKAAIECTKGTTISWKESASPTSFDVSIFSV